MQRQPLKIVRAPLFIIELLLGWMAVFFVIATISIGGWFEAILVRLGYNHKPVFLPAVIGIGLFVGLGLVGVGILGGKLLGTPGVCLGPLLAIGAIAIADHW